MFYLVDCKGEARWRAPSRSYLKRGKDIQLSMRKRGEDFDGTSRIAVAVRMLPITSV